MKIVLLMSAIFFALGCGPQGLPVSDVSSYKLDYYDYAQNRLPIEEQIVDGQCLLWLQPATNAMFADYNNPQDAANVKTQFIGALSECGEKFLAFAERIDDIRVSVSINRRQLQKRMQSGQPVTGEDTQEIWYADQALPLLAKMSDGQRAKYTIASDLAGCLKQATSENEENHCIEEVALTLEGIMPKE